MADDVVRWSGGTVRLGPWRGRPDVAYLAVGARRPPSPELVQRWLGMLRGRGFSEVVTNALAPAETLPFVDAGFGVHERLHLLAHDLDAIPCANVPTRRARPGDRDTVLDLDGRAFPPFWRLDRAGLEHAVGATPTSRFRVAVAADHVVGYCVTGRAERQGYLQRVGVDPDHFGRGLGTGLVVDSLRWLRRHRCVRALVNTQLENESALGLYRSCGFRPLPTGLCVLSRSL